jgi:deoxyhypusine synthase
MMKNLLGPNPAKEVGRMTQTPDPAKFHRMTDEQRAEKRRILSTEVSAVDSAKAASVVEMVEAMQGMSIQARNVGDCARVLRAMMADKERPTIFLGLAGPLIAAGLRNVIRELIVQGAVDVVVSTGAILYQDIYQARGYRHYRGTPSADDVKLHDHWIDRIYDTYVDEEKFWETDLWCGLLADKLEPGNYSSRQYLDFVGSHLEDENSIVRQCHKHGVPMFAPAINDSSIGIGLTEHYHRRRKENRPMACINSIQDNYELTQLVVKSPKTAAIYVAGGVPKNYINDAVVMGYIFDLFRGHDYAIQVTADAPHWGGLSGSTLKEAQSWGKVDAEAHTAMAFVEPSVGLTLLGLYTLQAGLAKDRRRLKLDWDGDILKNLRAS